MQLLTTTQVAKILAVSRQTVLNYIRSGKLKARKFGNGQQHQWRILESDLDAFVNGS